MLVQQIFLQNTPLREKRGLYTSLVPASTATGLLLGSLMAAAMFAFMSEAFLHEYGWRIPFLLAAPIGLIGYYIRVKLEETPEFLEHQKIATKKFFQSKPYLLSINQHFLKHLQLHL